MCLKVSFILDEDLKQVHKIMPGLWQLHLMVSKEWIISKNFLEFMGEYLSVKLELLLELEQFTGCSKYTYYQNLIL